ncbi:MAG: LytR/AlgR family response regulator transcription factor [Kofleriaceae bacterium]
MKLRVLIVDDEHLARRRLSSLIARTEQAEVVGEAGDSIEAVALIQSQDPDVALLDVCMPGMSGVELARGLGVRPVVVFTTAYGEHAVDAFDSAAVDYLLKPIDPDKLARALDRAASRLRSAGPVNEPRITARSGDVVRVFAAREIARFSARDKYTTFMIANVEHLLEEALASLESRLAAWGFVRVHRAELVQIARVRAVHSRDLELDTGERVPISRRLLASVKNHFAT